jgi:hypothetical protein
MGERHKKSDFHNFLEKYIQEGIEITLLNPGLPSRNYHRYSLWKLKVRKFLKENGLLNQSDSFLEADEVTEVKNNLEVLTNLHQNYSELVIPIREETKKKLIILRELRRKDEKDSAKLPKVITYYPKVGRGKINDKSFSFNKPKKGVGKAFRLFAKLYEKMNEPVNKYDVLQAIGFYEEGEEQDLHKSVLESKAIADIATKIREKTGLNTNELVVNGGDITLFGKKQE